MRFLGRILTAIVFLAGCQSTSEQETRVLDGSFAPEIQFEIRPNESRVAEDKPVSVTHTARNASNYDVWVCRLSGKNLSLSGWACTITVVSHPTCDQMEVLKPGESMTWLEDLDLQHCTCRKSKELIELAPELAERLTPCFGMLEIESVVTFHFAPPGKHWPRSWVPETKSAKSTSEVYH